VRRDDGAPAQFDGLVRKCRHQLQLSPTTLRFVIEADDLLAPLSLLILSALWPA
jgi:hypothetical protein